MFKKRIKEQANQKIILLILLIIILMVAINNNLLEEDFFASEFTPMYLRGRAYLKEGITPYSVEVQQQIQESADLGQSSREGQAKFLNPVLQNESSFYFLYGIPALLLMFIPILIPSVRMAMVIWLVMNEIAILGTIFVIGSLVPKRNRRMVQLFLLASLLFLPVVYLALLNGSLVILEMFFAWLVIYFLVNQRDELAGVFLALLVGRLILFLPFIILIFIWLFSQKRFQILKSYALTSLIVLGLSFALVPSWIFELFYTISIALDEVGFGVISNLAEGLHVQGNVLVFFFVAVAIGLFAIEFILVLQRKMLSFVWFVVLQFALMPWLGLPLSVADYYILYPASAVILLGWYAKFGKKLNSRLYLFASLISLVLWILLLQNVAIVWFEILSLLVIGINLYWVRWWLIDFERMPHSTKDKLKNKFMKRFRRLRKSKENDEIA